MRALVAKHGATVAIIALLVLNIVLIVPLIVNRNHGPSHAAGEGTPAASTVASSSPTADSPSPSPTADASSAAPALVSDKPRQLLAVNSGQIAWRAEASGCGQDSKLEVTTDGGKTWQVTDSGLRSVVRLKAFGDSSVFAIGADDNCNPVYAVDAYPGAEWQQDNSTLSNVWYRVPDDLNSVHDPRDKTSQPCGTAGLVDFAGLGDTKGVALCGDSSLRTRDGGSDWQTSAKTSYAVALNADDKHFVMAEQTSQCDGIAAQRFNVQDDKLKTVKKAQCFDAPHLQLNDVAVSNQGAAVWLWSGDVSQTS